MERVVRLRQMVRRWRKWAPEYVPAGHVAVCVGRSSRRFVVRVAHLNHPIFRYLLELAAAEYGFSACSGVLTLPCDECFFEDLLRYISESALQPTKTKLSSPSSSPLANLRDRVSLGLRCFSVAGGADEVPVLRRIAEKWCEG